MDGLIAKLTTTVDGQTSNIGVVVDVNSTTGARPKPLAMDGFAGVLATFLDSEGESRPHAPEPKLQGVFTSSSKSSGTALADSSWWDAETEDAAHSIASGDVRSNVLPKPELQTRGSTTPQKGSFPEALIELALESPRLSKTDLKPVIMASGSGAVAANLDAETNSAEVAKKSSTSPPVQVPGAPVPPSAEDGQVSANSTPDARNVDLAPIKRGQGVTGGNTALAPGVGGLSLSKQKDGELDDAPRQVEPQDGETSKQKSMFDGSRNATPPAQPLVPAQTHQPPHRSEEISLATPDLGAKHGATPETTPKPKDGGRLEHYSQREPLRTDHDTSSKKAPASTGRREIPKNEVSTLPGINVTVSEAESSNTAPKPTPNKATDAKTVSIPANPAAETPVLTHDKIVSEPAPDRRTLDVSGSSTALAKEAESTLKTADKTVPSFVVGESSVSVRATDVVAREGNDTFQDGSQPRIEQQKNTLPSGPVISTGAAKVAYPTSAFLADSHGRSFEAAKVTEHALVLGAELNLPDRPMLDATKPTGAVHSHSNVVPQIAEAIRTANGTTIEVSLSPEELGKLRIAMSPSDNGMVVQITAERPDTIDLIRRNIELLAQDLRNGGFTDLQFSFGDEAAQRDARPDSLPAVDPVDDIGVPPSEAIASRAAQVNGRTDNLDLRL